MMIRRSFGDGHAKLGYDFAKQQWYFETVSLDGSAGYSAYESDTNAIEIGKWYDFEFFADEYDVKLLADGKEVFSTTIDNDVTKVYYGRIGFGASESTYSFDDIEYSGAARVTAGVTYTSGGRFDAVSVVPGTFYKGDDGIIYGTNLEGSVISKDGGLTWQDYIPTEYNTDRTLAKAIVRMPDGTLVQLLGSAATGAKSKISKDNGKTWSEEYVISTEHGSVGAVSRLTCTKAGRLFVCTTLGAEEFGLQFVFYSDDGINWTKSETDFSTYNTGIIMNEAIVIDTPRENEVWFYGRSNSGFLDYWVSYDNGKTFDLTPHHSGLVHPETCFRIERDWENPETYYAIFVYDTETSNQRYIQNPRNRPSLAVSYDGMETWEFITELMVGTSSGVHAPTSDSVIYLIEDNLIWRTSNASGYGGQYFGAQKVDKIKTLKRMPALQYRTFIGYAVSATTALDHCVLPKSDGRAWLYGDYYDVKVSDGRCELAVVERMFGVTAVMSGKTVTLTLADGKVTFTEGIQNYDVNGETRTADRVVYSDGYLDIKTLSEIFGRVFRETENSYSVLDKAESVERYQKQIDNLV